MNEVDTRAIDFWLCNSKTRASCMSYIRIQTYIIRNSTAVIVTETTLPQTGQAENEDNFLFDDNVHSIRQNGIFDHTLAAFLSNQRLSETTN